MFTTTRFLVGEGKFFFFFNGESGKYCRDTTPWMATTWPPFFAGGGGGGGVALSRRLTARMDKGNWTVQLNKALQWLVSGVDAI